VSSTVKQALLITLGGLGLAAVVLVLARRRLISLRYTFGWLAVAATVTVSSFFAGLVKPVARVFDMTPTAVFLAAATVLLVGLSVQLSISVSGMQNQIRDLAETNALLAARLDEVGPARSPDDG
jgi:Uncharacterized conserved protein (DUF2304)